MIVYVSGPYTRGDPVVNTRKAILAGEAILEKGHVPYIPHLNLLWHIVVPHDPDFWYQYDLVFLKKCDAIYRISGESVGADNEVEVAEAFGLPVFHSTEDIPDA